MSKTSNAKRGADSQQRLVLPKLTWGDFMDLPNMRSCGYGATPVGGYQLKKGWFVWEMWPCGFGPSQRGKAKTWQAAKAAVNKAWRDFWQNNKLRDGGPMTMKNTEDTIPPFSAAHGSADTLANKIALAILTSGSGILCHRVQLKSGSWPDKEKDEGGLCQSALEVVITKQLIAAGYPPNA